MGRCGGGQFPRVVAPIPATGAQTSGSRRRGLLDEGERRERGSVRGRDEEHAVGEGGRRGPERGQERESESAVVAACGEQDGGGGEAGVAEGCYGGLVDGGSGGGGY